MSSTGHLDAVYLRVADVDRAARFFEALFGATFSREERGSHVERRMTNASAAAPARIDAIFTDSPSAPAVRLGFACEQPEAALQRVLELGGTGVDVDAVADDQGVPSCLTAGGPAISTEGGAASGSLGVAIVQVPDTGRARAFYEGLFGQAFEKVGAGDFWWVDSGPSWGVFPITHDLTNPPVPRERTGVEVSAFFCVTDPERAKVRVRELGGETFEEVSFGPYGACHCRNDQGLRFALWWALEP